MSEHDPPGDGHGESDQADRADQAGGPASFEHHEVTPTPHESQKRLFAARHRKAKEQRRGERRRKRVNKVVMPLIIGGLIVILVGATLRNLYMANRVAEDMSEPETEESGEGARPALVKEEADEVKEARDRFLLRDASSPEATNEGQAGKSLQKRGE